eukprot:12431061-Karenia_brevis.AAC.1
MLAGGYHVAIKRNHGHASQVGLVGHLALPLARQTVANWERQLAASILAQSNSWYSEAYRVLDDIADVMKRLMQIA